MAYETITYLCGHEAPVWVTGNRRNRDSYKEWASGHLDCPDCRQAEWEKSLESSLEKDKIDQYPPLYGTEKQVRWASKLRREFASYILSTLVPEYADDVIDYIVDRYDSAKWYIDNRPLNYYNLSNIMNEMYAEGIIKTPEEYAKEP